MSPRKVTRHAGGLRQAGVRNARTQSSYDTAVAKIKENWDLTELSDAFPAPICPQRELGICAINNLKIISELEKNLGKAQVLMFKHCIDQNGLVSIGLKHTEAIIKALRSEQNTDGKETLPFRTVTLSQRRNRVPSPLDISGAKLFQDYEGLPQIDRSRTLKHSLEFDEEEVSKKKRALPRLEFSPDIMDNLNTPALSMPALGTPARSQSGDESSVGEIDSHMSNRTPYSLTYSLSPSPAPEENFTLDDSYVPDRTLSSPPSSPVLEENAMMNDSHMLNRALSSPLSSPTTGNSSMMNLFPKPDRQSSGFMELPMDNNWTDDGLFIPELSAVPTNIFSSPQYDRIREHQTESPSLFSHLSIPYTDKGMISSPELGQFINHDSPTPLVSSKEEGMPTSKDPDFICRKEHVRICNKLYARIAILEKLLDEQSANFGNQSRFPSPYHNQQVVFF